MKKIKQLLNKRKQDDSGQSSSRITNETVAEHRERILAGGRKFKYPVQYSKHKLLINTVIISAIAFVIGGVLLWQQLYVAQNTSNLIYRITQIIPLPVAQIDGQPVRYSDYLMKYRSSIHFLENQDNFSPNTENGRRQAEFVKRQQLDTALKDTYVKKLARELDISVSDKEVTDFIQGTLEDQRVSERAFERTVLSEYYGWSMTEYREVVKTSLLKRKVSFRIDDAARERAQSIAQKVTARNFATTAKEQSDDLATKPRGGEVGTVKLDAPDPNGIIEALQRIEEGDLTELIQGSDGYYIAKLDDKNQNDVKYSVIKVSLTELDKRFSELKDSDKVTEYIEIEEQ